MGQFAIDMLLDEVLLKIFACYVQEFSGIDKWHSLTRVRRRWKVCTWVTTSPESANFLHACEEEFEFLAYCLD